MKQKPEQASTRSAPVFRDYERPTNVAWGNSAIFGFSHPSAQKRPVL